MNSLSNMNNYESSKLLRKLKKLKNEFINIKKGYSNLDILITNHVIQDVKKIEIKNEEIKDQMKNIYIKLSEDTKIVNEKLQNLVTIKRKKIMKIYIIGNKNICRKLEISNLQNILLQR